jgi:hypothetical protein
MPDFDGLKNTICKYFDPFKPINPHNRPVFLSYSCNLTEISIKMTFPLHQKKERKRPIKSVDLTEFSISLTALRNLPAPLSEMMLMFSEKHKHLFGKT